MATLVVRRDKGYADRIRKYRILVDGVEIGKLGEEESIRKEISEGPHVVEAKIDWCGSQPLELNAQPGEEAVIVRSALRGWRVMLGLLYVFFLRRHYLVVERE